MLLAAIVALAIAVAPVYASGAVPCPCEAAATDCPCHMGGCDMSAPPSAACHCAAPAMLSVSAVDLSAVPRLDMWLASPATRLYGLRPPPRLRPPILL